MEENIVNEIIKFYQEATNADELAKNTKKNTIRSYTILIVGHVGVEPTSTKGISFPANDP